MTPAAIFVAASNALATTPIAATRVPCRTAWLSCSGVLEPQPTCFIRGRCSAGETAPTAGGGGRPQRPTEGSGGMDNSESPF